MRRGKADQCREDKHFESLLGKILVYSISCDQKNARLYGHYALVEGEKWTYYRHHIANFDIVYKEMGLLTLHNFARNVLTVYAPKLLERLQKAIAALSVSSTLSFSASTMNLEDGSQQGSQQPSQGRDVEGFATPVLSASTQKLFDTQKEQMEQQLAQRDKQLESQKQEYDQQIKQMNLQLNALIKQMQSSEDQLTERLTQGKNESKQRHAELMEQNKMLIEMLSKGWTKPSSFKIFTRYIFDKGSTLPRPPKFPSWAAINKSDHGKTFWIIETREKDKTYLEGWC